MAASADATIQSENELKTHRAVQRKDALKDKSTQFFGIGKIKTGLCTFSCVLIQLQMFWLETFGLLGVGLFAHRLRGQGTHQGSPCNHPDGFLLQIFTACGQVYDFPFSNHIPGPCLASTSSIWQPTGHSERNALLFPHASNFLASGEKILRQQIGMSPFRIVFREKIAILIAL